MKTREIPHNTGEKTRKKQKKKTKKTEKNAKKQEKNEQKRKKSQKKCAQFAPSLRLNFMRKSPANTRFPRSLRGSKVCAQRGFSCFGKRQQTLRFFAKSWNSLVESPSCRQARESLNSSDV